MQEFLNTKGNKITENEYYFCLFYVFGVVDIYTITNISLEERGLNIYNGDPISRKRPFRTIIRTEKRYDDFLCTGDSVNNATASYYRAYPNCNYKTARKNSSRLIKKPVINFEIYLMRLFLGIYNDSFHSLGSHFFYKPPIIFTKNGRKWNSGGLRAWSHYFLKEAHSHKFFLKVIDKMEKWNNIRLKHNRPLLKKIKEAKARGLDTQDLKEKLYRYKKPYTLEEVGVEILKEDINYCLDRDISFTPTSCIINFPKDIDTNYLHQEK